MIIHKIEPKRSHEKQRVAAYARVSTDRFEQQESFETQVDYYTHLIGQNPDWTFAKVYADSGRSGTSTKKRPSFMEMIADAKAGKLDIILVKSIARFARNVADTQTYVHELKAHKVEVRFECEALSSFDPSADMVLNLLAVVAQEESRSISENVKWAYRKNAEQGIRRLGNNRVLGYDTDRDGNLVPNEDAWIVRQVFEDYANGLPPAQIVKHLNEAGAKRMRCDKPFEIPIIMRILNNEIYSGDRALQKEAPHNYLTKRPDATVSYTSYYITDDHPPIVDRDTCNRVKALLAQRKDERAAGVHIRGNAHFLYGKLFCSDCGAPYKRRTITRSGIVFKAWNCIERQKGKKGNGCKNVIIREDELLRAISDELDLTWIDAEHFDEAAFIRMVQRVLIDSEGVRIEKRKVA